MGMFKGPPKLAEQQAQLKKSADEAARAERDKAAAEMAAKENQAIAAREADQSARTAFVGNVLEDSEESRRKYLKKV